MRPRKVEVEPRQFHDWEWTQLPASADCRMEVLDGYRRMLDSVRCFTPRQRAVVEGRVWRGMTFQAIADEMGISVHTVRDHWYVARRRLARALRRMAGSGKRYGRRDSPVE